MTTFLKAKADTISALELYRERSQPTFLFFAGGQLVDVVRGALGPQLERAIKKQLAQEHLVLEGKAERNPIIDEGVKTPEPPVDEKKIPEPPPETPIAKEKEFTVMVIKPDAVKAGRVAEIIQTLQEQGVEILMKEERQMTKEEAAAFYKQHEGSEHFETLIDFMSSGPCMTLVVSKGETGQGVVEEIRNILGPKDVEKAKEEAPTSLRARYGTNATMNAVHASDSRETAARELAFFFPKHNIPSVPSSQTKIQRTVAIIRPDAWQQYGTSILAKIQEAGFQIAMQKQLTLTKEQAAEFYKEHTGKDYFDSLCTHMSSGPMMALCLAREDAVEKWREMLGPKELEVAKQQAPTSLRATFSKEGAQINPLHGSASSEEVEKDMKFFFPVEHTLAVIKPSAMTEKDNIMSKIKEAGFQVSLSKETHLTKEMAEQLYSQQKGKEFYGDLTDIMSSGPSLFMVLSREDAVLGWRSLMGPTDPTKAKEENPNTLRAMFGKSTLENAVHGSSNENQAKEAIQKFFGNVELCPDRLVKLPTDEKTNNISTSGTPVS